MHKDQKRVKDALLPFLMDRVLAEDAVAERDCTVLNRAFLQGPDPLFLMETCPKHFTGLCDALGLPEESGRDAIEQAHWRGPGVLLDGTGLPFDFEGGSDVPRPWKREALWLVLASLSDTTEEDYKEDITLVERLQRVCAAVAAFESTLTMFSERPVGPMEVALRALARFDAACEWKHDENGVPICEEDAGFYIGYKKGWKIAGVHHGDKTFFGTMPSTSLKAEGVEVDVLVSPQYGFRRSTRRSAGNE
jgi:hypothetical protein